MTKIEEMLADLCPNGSNSQGSDCLRWEIRQIYNFASLQRQSGRMKGC